MSYDASSIVALDGLEPVRVRPGMYIGDVGKDGFHHLIWEIFDNSVDEALNGHASTIKVIIHKGRKSVTVADNGRGIPVDAHPKTGRPAVEVILTTLHAGGKFDNDSYKNSGGLHGVGSSVVNALSTNLKVQVKRSGRLHVQEFSEGKPLYDLREEGDARGTGTQITFTPDPKIFGAARTFDPKRVRDHLEVSTYLNKGLKVIFTDEEAGSTEELLHEEGLTEFLGAIVKDRGLRTVPEKPFTFEADDGSLKIDVALTWTDASKDQFKSFANGITTQEGGTHEQGLKDGLSRALRNWMGTHEIQLPKGVKLTADDIREGVVALCSVFLGEPQFQSQTKDKLTNSEVRGAVEAAVGAALEGWFNKNKSQADAILARAVLAAKARMASREATSKVRRKSATSRRLNLPGKLADCSDSDPNRCELFIVEGDSAGGSAKQGRNREYQAILPLRGKVMNTESVSLKKVLANKELSDIVQALGCGIGKDLDLSKLRYDKIILLMDADSDGSHIATLMLTFFYRHMRPLIEEGHVFMAQPPLYKIEAGKKTWWAKDDAEKKRILSTLPSRSVPEISRFKGLGEMMPKTLYETTLDPNKRRLLRVTIPDGKSLETEECVSSLMGKDSQARYEAISALLG